MDGGRWVIGRHDAWAFGRLNTRLVRVPTLSSAGEKAPTVGAHKQPRPGHIHAQPRTR